MSLPYVSPFMCCVMLAIQLDLFSGQPVAPSFESAADYDEPARRAGLVEQDFNPCPSCELRAFCGSDDCAQHLFPLDIEEPEYEDFEDWLCGAIDADAIC